MIHVRDWVYLNYSALSCKIQVFWQVSFLLLFFHVVQIEDYNKPFLYALKEYDDGQALSDYDFSRDSISPPHDDINKKKLAYRHRVIAHKYEQVLIADTL